MKKIIITTLCFIYILLLFGCASKTSSNTDAAKTYTKGPENTDSNSINIEELKEKYPEYFKLSASKGIEIYIWQMAKNSYRCGIMDNTNRNKTKEEIWELQEKSLSVEETQAILNELNIDKNDITVIPTSQPYSSYIYKIDDEYKKRVTKLFK